MARSMFPFDDFYRMTFSGTLLPTQNSSGEIMPVEFSDSPIGKLELNDAPLIPLWRKKDTADPPKVQFSNSAPNSTEDEQNCYIESSQQKSSDTIGNDNSFKTVNNNNNNINNPEARNGSSVKLVNNVDG